MPRFSRRASFELEPNTLSRRRSELEAAGADLVDLAAANPTRCGLSPVVALPPAPAYDPDPLGLSGAREAVAALHGVTAARVVLSASTSEAWSWLFKLLCDPGDEVLVPRPGYPLLEHLAALEGVRLVPYPLRADGARWALDVPVVAAQLTERTRAVLVVSPANPTGHLVEEHELGGLAALCAARGVALVADEVFHDALRHGRHVAGRALPCLTFGLGGLSKYAGLPQHKLAWTVASGPEALVHAALASLEVIADTFLSVATPVQLALPSILEQSAAFRATVHRRVEENRHTLGSLHRAGATWTPQPALGGWAQVIRVPESRGEDALCLAALDAGVVVQPGYFYDFPSGAWLVLSLLAQPGDFARGVERLVRVLDE